MKVKRINGIIRLHRVFRNLIGARYRRNLIMFRTNIALACVVLILVAAGKVTGCTYVDSPSPCTAFHGTPVVFAGLVKSIDEEKLDILRFGKKETIRVGLIAHFAVEERLKDISAAEVDVGTGGGGGDCGYDFKAGERYLVYAY